MLGTLRFFLAFFVMLSHLPNNNFQLNLGITSVILFYFISGYLMTKSFLNFQIYKKDPIRYFFIDRFFRIFPLYILILTITIFAIFFIGQSQSITILNQELSFSKILFNYMLFPVNYVFEPFNIDILNPHPLIPPAWSLSTELHFYLIFPLIIILNKKCNNYFIIILMVFSMFFAFYSYFHSLGIINYNNFGYRFLPGVLFIFLLGYLFATKETNIWHKYSFIFFWIIICLMFLIVALAFNLFEKTFVNAITLGLFFTLPIGYFIVDYKIKNKFIKNIDEILGTLSYPIFLSHFFIFYFLDNLIGFKDNRISFYIFTILATILLSYLLLLFQKKIDLIRINYRGFKSQKYLQ